MLTRAERDTRTSPRRRATRVGVAPPRSAVARLLPAGYLAGVIAVGCGTLVTRARHLWFYGDEWSFLVNRTVGSLLEPHNEHWTSTPLLVYRAGVHVLGVDHYLVWAMLPIALHLLVCVALHALARQHGLPAWPSVLAVAALAMLSGYISENPLWVFQVGFLTSLLTGLAAMLVLGSERGGPRSRTAAAWLLVVLSMTCSGMALPVLGWVVALELLTRGPRRAAVVAVVPMVVFVAWYVAYGSAAAGRVPLPTPRMAVDFMWEGVSSTWTGVLDVPGAGFPVFVGLLAVVLATRTTASYRPLALSGLLASLVMYAFISISRGGLGPAGATPGRYAYFALTMGVPALAALLTLVGERLPSARECWVGGAVLTVLLGIVGVSQTVEFSGIREGLTPGFEQRAHGAVDLLRAGEPTLPTEQLDPTHDPGLTAAALGRADVLASFSDDPATTQGRLDASVSLQASVTTASPGLPTATGASATAFATDVTPAPVCVGSVAGPGAYVDLPPTPQGSQIAVRAWAESLEIEMVGPGVASTTKMVTTTPETIVYVATTAPGWTLRVPLPDGIVAFCPAQG